jgi:hypothetical protein
MHTIGFQKMDNGAKVCLSGVNLLGLMAEDPNFSK